MSVIYRSNVHVHDQNGGFCRRGALLLVCQAGQKISCSWWSDLVRGLDARDAHAWPSRDWTVALESLGIDTEVAIEGDLSKWRKIQMLETNCNLLLATLRSPGGSAWRLSLGHRLQLCPPPLG